MKRKIVLSESKFRGLVKNIITEILVKKAYSKFYSDIPEDIYNKIANVDNTRGNHLGAYAKWLLELYKKNKFDLNNLDNAKKYISIFDRMAQAGQLKGVDINTFDSIDDMYELVKDNIGSDVITKGDIIRKVKETGAERVYQDSDWLVISPKTHEASCHYGANTKWCTTEKDNDTKFKEYISEGPLYTLINKKTSEKYQIHLERREYRNAENKSIMVSSLRLSDKLINAIAKGDKMKTFLLKYDWIDDFSEGIAKVKINYKYNFINQNGKLLSPNEWFEWVDVFNDGLASIQLKDKEWNFMKKSGELLSPDQWFDDVYGFYKGVSRVVINDKYNLLDQNGSLLSNQWYDEIDDFAGEFARIKLKDNGYNLISKNGKLVSNKWFDDIETFENGDAIVILSNKWNFINKNGELVSDKWFDSLHEYHNGIAKVKLNNKTYKVNLNDKTITGIE